MRLTKFGTVDLPDANGRDVIPVEVRTNIVELQNGSIDLDGNNSVYNSVNLSRNAVWYTNLQSSFEALARESNKGRLILRGQEIDNTVYLTTAKINRLLPNIDANKYGCEYAININFYQDYPFWLLGTDEPYYLNDGELLDDGWVLDDGNKTTITISDPNTTDSTTINNTGGATIYKGYFVISVEDSSTWEIENLRIWNITNGLELTYKSLSGDGNSGEYTIDWLSKTCLTEFSDFDHNQISIPNKQVDWFRLELDNNVIETSFTVLDGTPDVNIDVYWSKHYLK
jgi:hypothetical protein